MCMCGGSGKLREPGLASPALLKILQQFGEMELKPP